MIRFDDALNIISGRFVCIVDSQRREFSSKEDLDGSNLYKNHLISSIRTENDVLVLELQPWKPPVTDIDAEWIKEHIRQNGSEPNFF